MGLLDLLGLSRRDERYGFRLGEAVTGQAGGEYRDMEGKIVDDGCGWCNDEGWIRVKWTKNVMPVLKRAGSIEWVLCDEIQHLR